MANKIWKKIYSRLEYRVLGLTARRIRSRFDGPTIMVNSIPKGGTHLLMRCLMHFPTLSYSGQHFTEGDVDLSIAKRLIAKNGKGRYFAAHMWYRDDVSALYADHNVKCLLMIRDPRDIIVSGVHFILSRPSHHMHRYFKSIQSKDDQIRNYIEGVAPDKSDRNIPLYNIRKSYENYTNWDRSDYNLTIRFEDLIGPRGGGSELVQRGIVKEVADHLSLSLSEYELQNVLDNSFSTKSVTFRKGSSGDWSNHFSIENKDIFKEVSGDLLQKYKYEESHDW